MITSLHVQSQQPIASTNTLIQKETLILTAQHQMHALKSYDCEEDLNNYRSGMHTV